MEAVDVENKRVADMVSGATEVRWLHMHALLLQNLPVIIHIFPPKFSLTCHL